MPKVVACGTQVLLKHNLDMYSIHNKQYMYSMKALLNSFHLNSHTLGFHPWQDSKVKREITGAAKKRNFYFTQDTLGFHVKTQKLAGLRFGLGLGNCSSVSYFPLNVFYPGGLLNKVLYGEAPSRGPNPYPFIYQF